MSTEAATPEATPLFESAQYCACGWLLPRSNMVFIDVHSDAAPQDFSVDLQMLCPQCGKSFELNDIELLVTQ